MADLAASFRSSVIHKRKREYDILDDSFNERDIKKRPITSLPIRSPPRERPFLQRHPTYPVANTNNFPAIDLSEEHHVNRFTREDWIDRMPTLSHSQSSQSSTSSIKVQVEDHDEDMEMQSPARRIGRARSNDILTLPLQRSHLLSPGIPSSADRIPTPINSRFDSRLSSLPTAPRHSFPPLRTNLSPMIEQDGWSPRRNESSSSLDHGMDAVMLNEQNDNETLEVSADRTSFDHDMMDTEGPVHMQDDLNHFGDSLNLTAPDSDRNRTARLHMGYLQGCDKCLQKVPGHYSHILWS